MSYILRLVHYSNLLKEIEIAGDEHLKTILEKPSEYLAKAEKLRENISSDPFLLPEDKEKMLKKVNSYIQQVKPKKDEIDLQSFLLGTFLAYLATNEDFLSFFVEELLKLLGVTNAVPSQT
jgi:hypothetical protein